ncbi:MAG: hypothetical protein CFE27_15820 [Alphaproteobacteria bacterium PA1]|jgi:hypothetical protein|nr:MAG: hypothetical protein CFE27_15820 [Alphaproteobacteria bacterium PA1]
MRSALRLSDDELNELAWRAIRKFFPAEQLDQASIELEHTVWSNQSWETGLHDGGEVVGVWLSHPKAGPLPDPDATAAVTTQMMQEAYRKGDPRMVILYHKFPDVEYKRQHVA